MFTTLPNEELKTMPKLTLIWVTSTRLHVRYTINSVGYHNIQSTLIWLPSLVKTPPIYFKFRVVVHQAAMISHHNYLGHSLNVALQGSLLTSSPWFEEFRIQQGPNYGSNGSEQKYCYKRECTPVKDLHELPTKS
jgi:hypothetical protein